VICVVIPSKTASNLIPCVRAVRDHDDCGVLAVNDGLDLAAIHNSGIQFGGVDGVKPFIFARNVNIGIRTALDRKQESPYTGVVLLNDDALLQTPNGFTKLAEFAEDHPEVGIVAPATNITGQRLQWPKSATPDGVRYVDEVPFVCVYLPRRTIERVGLLDERYCLDYGCEDKDYCTAVTRAGLKIAIMYDVYVDHGSLRSSFRGDPKQPASFVKNLALYNAKWRNV
jgi:GT2 family glycosyltransferase